MNSENICKFPFADERKYLSATHFVLETDSEIAEQVRELNKHTIYLMVEGNGTFVVNGREYSAQSGTLLFGFAGERVFMQNSRSPKYFYIGFEGNHAEELLSRFSITPSARIYEKYESLIPFWEDNLIRAEEHNIDLVCESVLIYTFSRLVPTHRENDEVIFRLLRYLEENFTDSELSLSGIAQKWGYNEKYISHRFKLHTGSTFSTYLRTLRIRHAIYLFDHGVISVKNVALLCGFSDPFYFSKVFKETVGVTPKDYLISIENSIL